MAHFPLAGVTDPSTYLDSVVRLADEALALTGIRFRGGDPSKPFIDVIALEGGISEEVLLAIDARWSRFTPLCIRLSVPAADAVDFPRFGLRSRVDSRMIAGRVADIVANPGRVVPGLSVHRATDMSWYEQYRREYDRFLAADPVRQEWTHPETYDSLALTLQESGIYLVSVHGDLAGVYSMTRGCAHGLTGFRVQEKFLFDAARGKGHGTAAEHMVIRRLPAHADDVVFGSVEDRNAPSRRSAYRTGRVDIGAKVWLTPLNRPGMPD